MISTRSVVASSDHRTFCTGLATLFEQGLHLSHGGIVGQAWFFTAQGFRNLGTEPLVVAGLLFYGFELGNDGRKYCTHGAKISTPRARCQPMSAERIEI